MSMEAVIKTFRDLCSEIEERNPEWGAPMIAEEALIELVEDRVLRLDEPDPQETVEALASKRSHPVPEGWVLLYYFPKGGNAYGVGAASSKGEVWESIRRMNENNLAQHIAAALRMRQNGSPISGME
jgi:hypothetical protein